MTPPIMPVLNPSPVPADATAVAPPSVANAPQGPPQPEPGSYEHMLSIYQDAVRLLRMRGPRGRARYSEADVDEWIKHQPGIRVRTLQGLTNLIGKLDREGKRPLNADDLTPLERGAFARTVRFGASAGLGLTDELAGLVSAVIPGGPGYRAGRDEARQYLEQARDPNLVDPGIISPELMGIPASILATMGTSAPVQGARLFSASERAASFPGLVRAARALSGGEAPGLIRAVGTGAGYGAASALGAQEELTPEALAENAVPLALQTGFGAFMGGAPTVAGKAYTALTRPGMNQLDRTLSITPNLERAVARSGVERPMLAELEATDFSGLARELRRSRPASATARRRVAKQLNSVRRAIAKFDPAYDALQVPMTDERVLALVNHDRVHATILRMIKDKKLIPGQPVTGRALEDIRQVLNKQSRAQFNAGNEYDGQVLRELRDQAQMLIDEGFAHMPDVRRQLSPLISRRNRLEDLELDLARKPRTGGVPFETKVTAKGEAQQDIFGERWQRAHRGYQQMAGPLFTPGTAAEHIERIRRGLGPMAGLGRIAPAGAYAPRVVDPFFPMEPQEP